MRDKYCTLASQLNTTKFIFKMFKRNGGQLQVSSKGIKARTIISSFKTEKTLRMFNVLTGIIEGFLKRNLIKLLTHVSDKYNISINKRCTIYSLSNTDCPTHMQKNTLIYFSTCMI